MSVESDALLKTITKRNDKIRKEVQVLKQDVAMVESKVKCKMEKLEFENCLLRFSSILMMKKLSHENEHRIMKREVEMQQRIELEEETCTELKQVFASLQQQVDFKRDKLKRLNNKLQSVRQEIKDNHEVYLKDRQEVESANDEAALNLRQSFLIIDNFVPAEERSRIISLAEFDEDLDNWVLKKDTTKILPPDRPIAHNYRRPISEYAIQRAQDDPSFRGENVLDLKLDMPLRTTQDYTPPKICPQIKALVGEAFKKEMENNHISIKIPPHSVGRSSSISKLDQEGKYKQALKSVVDINNLKGPSTSKAALPRPSKSSYQLKQT